MATTDRNLEALDGWLEERTYSSDLAPTGAACFVVHRSALEAIRDKYGPTWFSKVTHPKGRSFSEDLSMMIRAAGCDLPVMVHTGIRTAHLKGGVHLVESLWDEQEAQLGAGRRVASVSDEPSNAASKYLRNAYALMAERGSPSEEAVRAALTDDFAYEDRHSSGVSFPDSDAEFVPKIVLSYWQSGAGQPRWEFETLAVRGERFAALAVQRYYGNGMLSDSLCVIGLDATLRMVQRLIDFEIDDVDGAIAELDRLHNLAPEG